MFRHMLVHLDKSEASAVRADAAMALARRLGARLTGLYAVCDPDVPSLASKNRYLFVERAAGMALAAFSQHASNCGTDVDTLSDIGATDVQVTRAVVLRSREFDLVVLGQFNPATADGSIPSDLVETTVLHAGRPVLVIPHHGHFTEIGRSVVLAWNGSREAARSVHDALPLLRKADGVTVLALIPEKPRSDADVIDTDRITRHLVEHGVPATADRVPFDAASVGPVERILAYLVDHRADLLVMGAAGQQLGRSAVRRSLTGRVLTQLTAPILLSY